MKLLHELENAGFTVTTDGTDLNVSGPPEGMTDGLREQIRQHKEELITIVAGPMPARADLLQRCTDAVTGLGVDPDRLRRFLEIGGDPAWCTEPCARRLAELMAEGMIR